jgi:hypothetical protein
VVTAVFNETVGKGASVGTPRQARFKEKALRKIGEPVRGAIRLQRTRMERRSCRNAVPGVFDEKRRRRKSVSK